MEVRQKAKVAQDQPQPEQGQRDAVRQQLGVEINHRQCDQPPHQNQREQRIQRRTQQEDSQHREQCCDCLDDGITGRNAGIAGGALAPQEQVAQHRDVLPGLDLVATARAGGIGRGQSDALRRFAVFLRQLQEFLALAAPVLLHHFGEAEDDDVEEAAYAEGDDD